MEKAWRKTGSNISLLVLSTDRRVYPILIG